MSHPDSKNLRIFGAAFDYTDRTEARLDAGAPALEEIFARHTNATDRIAAVGSTVQNELGIRDLAIEFLHGELSDLGSLALSFVTATRMTSEMRKAGIEIPEEARKGVAFLFEELEAKVGG